MKKRVVSKDMPVPDEAIDWAWRRVLELLPDEREVTIRIKIEISPLDAMLLKLGVKQRKRREQFIIKYLSK